MIILYSINYTVFGINIRMNIRNFLGMECANFSHEFANWNSQEFAKIEGNSGNRNRMQFRQICKAKIKRNLNHWLVTQHDITTTIAIAITTTIAITIITDKILTTESTMTNTFCNKNNMQ